MKKRLHLSVRNEIEKTTARLKNGQPPPHDRINRRCLIERSSKNRATETPAHSSGALKKQV
jgi:hypothetical protein